jgi:hypothetical protein
MTNNEIERLRYRRQYVLLPFQTECPFQNELYVVDDKYTLYTHIDLTVTLAESDDTKLFLLGDIFDFAHTGHNNLQILNSLLKLSFTSLLSHISRYNGRFVLIFSSKGQIKILHDAASARKVYYFRHQTGVCCASQQHLLAKILNLGFTHDAVRARFYNSKEFRVLNHSNIGNTTCYDGMLQLIPNHYLELTTSASVRYWPSKRIESRSFDEVVDHSSRILKGHMESIINRHKVMLPVTAGKDSRLLLSATANHTDKVFYYINKESWLNEKSMDIAIPSKLLRKLGISYNIIDPYVPLDEDFKKVYFENNPLASELYLPLIYNYYLNFSDRINMPGIFINVAEDIYETKGEPLSPALMAHFMHTEKFSVATEYLTNWYKESKDICAECNIDVLYLLYWEERIANWGTQIQIDKDIAQEDIIPFNSRLLIETMLQADVVERERPDFRLTYEMTRKLWPQTLQMPINPHLKQTVLMISKTMGVMKPAKYLYYLSVYPILERMRLYLQAKKLS